MKINTKLLPMKAHYLLMSSGTAPLSQYFSVIAKELGFSAFLTSVVFTLIPITSLFAKPAAGAIADRFGIQKTLFLFFIAVMALSYFSLLWNLPLPTDSSVDLHCSDGLAEIQICSEEELSGCLLNDLKGEANIQCQIQCDSDVFKATTNNSLTGLNNQTLLAALSEPNQIGSCISFKLNSLQMNQQKFIPACNKYVYSSCEMACNNPIVSGIISKPLVNDVGALGYFQFWHFLFAVVIGKVASTIIGSIGDAVCFNILGEDTYKFGRQKLWGSVGWGVTGVISGFIVDYMSKGPKKDFTIAHYMSLTILIFDFLYKVAIRSKNICKDLKKAVAGFRARVFMVWCTIAGIYQAVIFNFLFWHLEVVNEQSGCGSTSWMKTLQGIVIFVDSFAGEIPFYVLSGWLIRKFGHIHSMTFVLVAYGIRMVLFSLLTNAWYSILISLLNGPTYSLFYATMATYASKNAPVGTETTFQALVASLFDSLGSAIGSLLGGTLLQHYGGWITFRIFGISALVFAILHFLTQFCHQHYSSKEKCHLQAAT